MSNSDPSEVENAVAARRAGTVTVLAILGMAGTLALSPHYCREASPQPPDAEPLQPAILVGVDPNEAEWYQLAQLPGIGESIGRRIVEQREEQRRLTRGARPVFRDAADLLAMRGIGPRTMLRIGRFLQFPVADNQPGEPRKSVEAKNEPK